MTTTTRTLLTLTLALLSACGGNQNQPPDDDSGDATAAEEETGATDETGAACVEAPQDSSDLLNACGDAACEPFANTKERLPLLADDGKRPPLP